MPFSSLPLPRRLWQADARENVTAVLVPSVLHADAVVRTALVSLEFDIATPSGVCTESEDPKSTI